MTLLTMEEWSTEVERLGDELDALNRCCETARAQLAGLLDQNGAGAQPVPSGEALIQCVATVNIQRQHIAALWRLVADALQRNVRTLQPQPPAKASRLALATGRSAAPRIWP